MTHPGWNIDSNYTYLGSPVNAYVPVPGYNLYYPYDTMNVHVVPNSPGICRLNARKGNYLTDYWSKTQGAVQTIFQYSNGSLSTYESFRFGYYEIKFRLPSNVTVPGNYNAYQPTFWLYNKDTTINVRHSEIDIFEISEKDGDFTNGGYFRSAASNSLNSWHLDNVDTVTNGVWHTAAVNWTNKKIDYYYDGELKRTETTYADSLMDMRIFIEANVPLYLNVNVPIDPVNTVFPFTYEIDYVRIYQPTKACDTSKVYLNTTLAGFTSKLYKDLTLGGSGGSAYFNGGIASALGNDFVLLSEGTEVSNTMEMYFDVLPCSGYQVNQRTINTSPPLNDYRYQQIKNQ